VTSSKATAGQNPGQKLVEIAQECAAVAQGVMIWAKEFTKGEEYANSASFPTLSGCILSLVRVVAIDQPFARKEAINIAIQFLGHSNSDISHQKVSAIKEQSLRLLVFLLVKGEVVDVLNGLGKLIACKGKAGLDASLIRYFIRGLVSVVQPPVSFIFARLFVELLRSPSCADAVRSDYFPAESRAQLNVLLKSFQAIPKSLALRKEEDQSMRKKYQAIFDSVASLYQAN
jgi:hypothetical protein